ncbi:hypothetical protein B0H16DRAFT_1537553 [Mycena metata]|uniref:Uncharacterized protein n=1 Tax=Mycena metata TaxID=1033252 RepID=A0AAD7J5V9_9AGAR|nr:hypothetical protein B0H16DRAFT_1537553 [Mycena metata]
MTFSWMVIFCSLCGAGRHNRRLFTRWAPSTWSSTSGSSRLNTDISICSMCVFGRVGKSSMTPETRLYFTRSRVRSSMPNTFNEFPTAPNSGKKACIFPISASRIESSLSVVTSIGQVW